MRWDLTIYAQDGVTPLLGSPAEAGNPQGSSFSTAPEHPRPYLERPTDASMSEVDFLKGKANVGQSNVLLADVPMDPADQATGIITAMIGQERGGNGLRNRLTYTDDAGATVVLVDGAMSTPKLHSSLSGFSWGIKDENWRVRKMGAFTRTGTTCVFPRGPLSNYGPLPGGGWLLPAAVPVRGKFRRSAGGTRGYLNVDEIHEDVLTPAMEGATKAVWDETAKAYVLDQVEIWWRAENGGGAWIKLVRMPLPPMMLPAVGARRRALFSTRKVEVQIPTDEGGTEKADARRIEEVFLNTAPSGAIPAHDARVELLVVYVGSASKEYPFLFYGTDGEFLRNCVRGDYSAEPTPIRYHEPTLLSFTAPCAAAVSEPTSDLLGYLEKHWYQPRGAAPTLNSDGQLAPRRHVLPAPDAVLPVIDDSVCEASSDWSHPDANVINRVDFHYYRDVGRGRAGDPLGERTRGDGAEAVKVTVSAVEPDAAHPSLDRFGPKPLTITTELFRSLTLAADGAASGEATSETGHLLGKERGLEALDRFLFGAQTFTAPCVRTAAVAALQQGEWVELRCSWLPDYFTQMRGSARIAQVVGIRDTDPVRRELRLLDGGDALAPLAAPTLGVATADAAGVVTIPVTAVSPGADEALVDFAVTAPGAGAPAAGAWLPAGRAAGGGSVSTPPQPAGVRVWYRGYSAAPGRRRSAPTAPQSVLTPSTARILSLRVEVADETGAAVVRWSANGAAGGVRIYYAVHNPGSETPLLTAYVDHLASNGGATLPVTAGPAQVVSVEGEPWTGWTGVAVNGAAGDRVPASDARGSVAPRALAHLKASNDTTVTYEIQGPAGSTVHLVGISGAAGATLASGPAVGAEVAIAGSQWVFNRAALNAGEGQAEFLLTAPDGQTDTVHAAIAEQGRDTVGLQVQVRRRSSTATHTMYDVYVADPYPQGANTISVFRDAVDWGEMDPPTTELVLPPATNDIQTTSFVTWTVPLRAHGTGPGRLNFRARSVGAYRTPGLDSIDVGTVDQDTVTAGISLASGQEVNGVTPLTITYTPVDATITATVNGVAVSLVGDAPGTKTYNLVRSEEADQHFDANVSKPGINPNHAGYSVDKDRLAGISGDVDKQDNRTNPVMAARMDDDAEELRLYEIDAGEVLVLVDASFRGPGANTPPGFTPRHTFGTIELVYTAPALTTGQSRRYLMSAAKAGGQQREVWRGTVSGPPPDTNTITAGATLSVGAEVNGVTPLTLSYTPTDATVSATVNGAPVAMSGTGAGVRTFQLARVDGAKARFAVTVSKPGVNPVSKEYEVDENTVPGLSGDGRVAGDRTAQPVISGVMDDDAAEVYLYERDGNVNVLVATSHRGAGADTAAVKYNTVTLSYQVTPPLATNGQREYVMTAAKVGGPQVEVWRNKVTGPPPDTDTNTITPLPPTVYLDRYEQTTTGTQEVILLTAVMGLHATGTLRYRYRPVRVGYAEEPWTALALYTISPQTLITVDKVPVAVTLLEVEVTDGTRTTPDRYVVDASNPFTDPATGLPTPAAPPYSGAAAGTTVTTVTTDAMVSRRSIGLVAESRLPNGNAEEGTTAGWVKLFGADMTVDTTVKHMGAASFKIHHATPQDTIWYRDVAVNAGEIITVRGRLSSTALSIAAGGGFALNIDPAGGAVFQALDGGRRGPFQPAGSGNDLFDVGIPADGVARSFAVGDVESRFRVLTGGSVRVHLQFGYGGNAVAGTVRAGALQVIAEGTRVEDRIGLGGSQYEAKGNGDFRTWDPDFSVANGVCFSWQSHVVRFAGEDVFVPGQSLSGLPGNTVIYPWFDRRTGVRFYALTKWEGLDFDRVPLGAFRTAADQQGTAGGGTESGAPGALGGGTTVAPPPV